MEEDMGEGVGEGIVWYDIAQMSMHQHLHLAGLLYPLRTP